MIGRSGQASGRKADQRPVARRRDDLTGYWFEQQRQKNQLVQYCLCGARKVRRIADGRQTTEYDCPNRHRPDHQPGAAYGRPLLLYRADR